MATRPTFKLALVEQLRGELAELPSLPPEQVSCKKAVKLLAPELTQLQERGYSIEAIAELLSSRGLRVRPTILKSYLSAAKRETPKKPKRSSTSITQPIRATTPNRGSNAESGDTGEKDTPTAQSSTEPVADNAAVHAVGERGDSGENESSSRAAHQDSERTRLSAVSFRERGERSPAGRRGDSGEISGAKSALGSGEGSGSQRDGEVKESAQRRSLFQVIPDTQEI